MKAHPLDNHNRTGPLDKKKIIKKNQLGIKNLNKGKELKYEEVNQRTDQLKQYLTHTEEQEEEKA